MTDFQHLLLDSYKILLANVKTLKNYSGLNFYLKRGNYAFEIFQGSDNNYVLITRGDLGVQEISLYNTSLDKLFKDYETFVANEFGISKPKIFQRRVAYSLNKNSWGRDQVLESLLDGVMLLKQHGINFSDKVDTRHHLSAWASFNEGRFSLYSYREDYGIECYLENSKNEFLYSRGIEISEGQSKFEQFIITYKDQILEALKA